MATDVAERDYGAELRRLRLSKPAESAAVRAGARTVEDLTRLMEADLRRVPLCGDGTVAEIVAVLAREGLSLAPPAVTVTSSPDPDDITLLGWSNRARRSLARAGIDKITQIMQMSPTEVQESSAPNGISLETLAEIRHVLSEDAGLNWGADLDVVDWVPPDSALQLPTADGLLDLKGLGLGVRAMNCLARGGIADLDALLQCTEDDLRDLRNCGSRTVDEILAALRREGLSLRAPDPMQQQPMPKPKPPKAIVVTRYAPAPGAPPALPDALSAELWRLLAKHGQVVFPGFGRLIVVRQGAKTGRNPRTGEAVPIPERNRIQFKASTNITDLDYQRLPVPTIRPGKPVVAAVPFRVPTSPLPGREKASDRGRERLTPRARASQIKMPEPPVPVPVTECEPEPPAESRQEARPWKRGPRPAPRGFLTRQQVAERLGVSVNTVDRWAVRAIGPKRLTVPGARTVRYSADDVDAWAARNTT